LLLAKAKNSFASGSVSNVSLFVVFRPPLSVIMIILDMLFVKLVFMAMIIFALVAPIRLQAMPN